jgi:hypothetical protein
MQTICNRPNSKATPSGSDLNKETREARYGKAVQQLTVQMFYASVWTPPREFRDTLVLDHLSQ